MSFCDSAKKLFPVIIFKKPDKINNMQNKYTKEVNIRHLITDHRSKKEKENPNPRKGRGDQGQRRDC